MILDCKAEIAKKDNVVVVPTSLPSFTLKFRKLGDSLKMGDDRGRIALSCPREHIAGKFDSFPSTEAKTDR